MSQTWRSPTSFHQDQGNAFGGEDVAFQWIKAGVISTVD
jgi:hypothetical protein